MSAPQRRPMRLSRTALTEHLAGEDRNVRRTAMALRRAVLREAPGAAEGLKFGCLCYFHPDADFGSIGGNICMIEVKNGAVMLSFIQGAALDDPAGLLRANGKAKRHVPVSGVEAAADPRLAALLRRAAAARAWER